MTTIRLLGPVEVLDGDGIVHAPKTPIRRTLLALLAIEAGTVVEPDRLLDRIWDGHPPESGLRALRFHLSRLRKEVPVDDLIVTVPGGYRLDADVDLEDVEAALDRLAGMDPDHRVEVVRELLGRWRGEPLVDVESCIALDHERQRLTELRATLTEQLYTARVDAGESSTVISELTGLCLEHPLREPLWASLITAQYRAGLQADALRSYDRLRRNLVEELGADPSPPLRELERRILDHSPTLQASAPTSTARGNLTAAPPGLLGRDGDTQLVLDQLAAHSLVTIAGVGGVGKSSLARQVAHSLAHPGNEVWFVELAPLSDAGHVLSTITATVGITSATPTPDELATLLRRRGEVVLVFDNCEHVVDGAAAVAARLAAEPGLRVLTTSRIQLGLADERIVRLAPLDDLDDAVELFAREARRRDPTFVLGNGRTDVIRAICDQLDRIPLAIELAAARTGSLGLGDIYDQLSQLLASRPVGTHADDRHATMTAAIAWSTDILPADAAAGLGVLSVVPGTFEFKAAAALLGSVATRPAFDVIDELVSHSLVEVIRLHDGLRYRILEPVRQHAAANLLDEPEAARDRHLEHYLDALEAAYLQLGTTSSDPIVDILRHDIDNLRAVHEWALESGRIDDDLRLYRPLMISVWHDAHEPGDWAFETLAEPAIESHERWREALACAFQTAAHRSGQALDQRAEGLYRQVEQAGPGAGDDLLQTMRAWITGSYMYDWPTAVALYDSNETDDVTSLFIRSFIGPLGRTILAGGDSGTGLGEFERGLEWARSIGALSFEAAILSEVAHLHQLFGDPQTAVEVADASVELSAANDMRHVEAQAALYRAQSIRQGATSTFSSSDEIRRVLESAVRAGNGARTIYSLNPAAQLLADAGRLDAAALAGIGSKPVNKWWHNRLDRIPDGAWQRARDRVETEHLELFDIGALTLTELAQLGSDEDVEVSSQVKW
jgi:predicted ATPase/DNA-binding SARP family transcriptional activator